MILRRIASFILSLTVCCIASAQFKTDRLLTSGKIALQYEDYVLAIQYFNQIISQKPYLYQPWHMRAVAKFYLEDFSGSEHDATEAINLNPYIDNLYDLRAIDRISQDKYAEAIEDYNRAIALNPQHRDYWFNRAICTMRTDSLDQALLQTDTICRRWSTFAGGYSLKAEILLSKKDTTNAMTLLDKSLELNPYNGNTWMTVAHILLSRRQWHRADSCLSQVLHLRPKHVPSYLRRALARVNINNLRGAIEDYNTALDLDPNNFLAHYNRGLLRMDLGDDNNAIEDFNYIIKIEPDNIMALYNRALLHDRTGNMHAAIRDYSAVINEFPNFWDGLERRAVCYRRIGKKNEAEMDEFRVFKAQMDKHLGIQPRWSSQKVKEVRLRTEIDPEKYSSFIIDETQEGQEYQSQYRGRIQNRSITSEARAPFVISLMPYSNGVKTYQVYDTEVERINTHAHLSHMLYVANGFPMLSEQQIQQYFAITDSIDTPADNNSALLKAVAYAMVQNYPDAIAQLDEIITADSTSTLAYWQRAICQLQMSQYAITQGIETRMVIASALTDINHALALSPRNPYLYFNRALLHTHLLDYASAIADYTHTILLEPYLAEAYFNRALIYISQGDKASAVKDLSKAGELGLYEAYSIIKRK